MYLPTAPSDKQKYSYLAQKRNIFYIFCILSSVLLFAGMFFFSFINPVLSIYSIFILVLLIYLLVSYMVGVKGKPFDFKRHLLIVNTYTDRTASVDIYLPICGESFDIIANTWKYVKNLDWPALLLNVYVLDDGWSDKAQELAASMGFHYIRRDNRPHLKKAGNIRNAFGKTKGDFIVILDADFCPRPDFISELMPYMISDDKIAIMQSPQFFEVNNKQTWIEQAAGSVQELFYRLIQVSRNTWGASICVGSCAMYRRAALEPQGGTFPIEHSEDLHTGFSMLLAGLKVKYVPINLAMGVCPDTLPAFFIQQYRWCTGSTSLMTNKLFWNHKLNFMARLSFLSGMLYYFATSSAIFLSVIPSMVVVWFFPDRLVWFTLVFYLPSFMFSVFFMKWWNVSPYSLSVLKIRQVSYWAYFFALKDKFMKTTVPWIPTGATTNVAGYYTFRKWLFWWSSISLIVVLSGSVRHMDSMFDINFYPTIFFCLFNYWVNITILRDQ
jgi:cellulose synthase/poly-beta-1,6-N-acetylglucosamine synthase-like glycosyltransferase